MGKPSNFKPGREQRYIDGSLKWVEVDRFGKIISILKDVKKPEPVQPVQQPNQETAQQTIEQSIGQQPTLNIVPMDEIMGVPGIKAQRKEEPTIIKTPNITELPKIVEQPVIEVPKTIEIPKIEVPKTIEIPKIEVPNNTELSKSEPSIIEIPKILEVPKTEVPKAVEIPKTQPDIPIVEIPKTKIQNVAEKTVHTQQNIGIANLKDISKNEDHATSINIQDMITHTGTGIPSGTGTISYPVGQTLPRIKIDKRRIKEDTYMASEEEIQRQISKRQRREELEEILEEKDFNANIREAAQFAKETKGKIENLIGNIKHLDDDVGNIRQTFEGVCKGQDCIKDDIKKTQEYQQKLDKELHNKFQSVEDRFKELDNHVKSLHQPEFVCDNCGDQKIKFLDSYCPNCGTEIPQWTGDDGRPIPGWKHYSQRIGMPLPSRQEEN